jgi:hypothetical protein
LEVKKVSQPLLYWQLATRDFLVDKGEVEEESCKMVPKTKAKRGMK